MIINMTLKGEAKWEIGGELGRFAKLAFFKSRSSGSKRNPGPGLSAPPWEAAVTYYYVSGSGSTKEVHMVRKNSGIPGLVASANEDRMFDRAVIAIEFDGINDKVAKVYVIPDKMGIVIGKGGVRIKFVQETLGLRLQLIPAETRIESRLVKSEKGNWVVQTRTLITNTTNEFVLVDWHNDVRGQYDFDLKGPAPKIPEAPVQGLLYFPGITAPEKLFEGINIHGIREWLSPDDIRAAAEFLNRPGVFPWRNSKEMVDEFNVAFATLVAQAELPKVVRVEIDQTGEVWGILENGAKTKAISVAVRKPDFKDGPISLSYKFGEDVHIASRNPISRMMEIREERYAVLLERYVNAPKRAAEEETRRIQMQNQLTLAQQKRVSEGDLQIPVFGFYNKKDGWTGKLLQNQGHYANVHIWMNGPELEKMEFRLICSGELNPNVEIGEATLVYNDQKRGFIHERDWRANRLKFFIQVGGSLHKLSIDEKSLFGKYLKSKSEEGMY